MSTPVARFAQRVARLPEALAILELHPQGLPLSQLADELGETPALLREALLAYYRADVVDLANFRSAVLEFIGSDGEDEDPATAEIVRVAASGPERELGVEHLTAEQLGALYQAGLDLLALEPDNATLADALRAFRAGLWNAERPDGLGPGAETAQLLNDAARRHRRVRVVYARSWLPGVLERVIEPYRAIRTRRGWEVDAGPVDDQGRIRTFLVSGIRECDLLDETFEPPEDIDELIRMQRQPVDVELVVPQTGRWAVDRYAESVTVLDDDEESVHLRAALLPPVEQRVGLILISCGPAAFVLTPPSLRDAGAEVAARLIEHHRAPAVDDRH
ncbi:MAG: helix-turn-helix transcriptional regulator [Actinomycetes bacterium]